MNDAKRDNNYIPTLLAVSNVDGLTPVVLYADPTTHRLLVSMSSALGDLSDVTITSAAGGDILYRNSGNTAWVNLAKGSDTNVLTLASGVPSWSAASAGDVTKVGTPVDNQIGVWTGDGTIEGTVNFTYDGANFQLTGDIGSTGTRITKIWATDLEVTNAIAGSVTGNAGTVSTITGLAPDTATTQATQPNITSAANLVTVGTLTGGATGAGFTVALGTSTITGILTSANGGTGNGFTKFSGATTAEKTYTLPDANATILYSGGSLGTPSGGTATNITGLPLTGLVDDTSTALGVGTLELGHASDTTLARVSAGVISVEGVTLPSISSTNTLTNKRITDRVWTAASDATPDVNSDDYDAVTITALAAAITDVNVTGTPTNFQKLIFRILDNGTARAIAWGTDFQAMGVALPTTTTISKVLTVGFIYDTVDSKWGCVASSEEA